MSKTEKVTLEFHDAPLPVPVEADNPNPQWLLIRDGEDGYITDLYWKRSSRKWTFSRSKSLFFSERGFMWAFVPGREFDIEEWE